MGTWVLHAMSLLNALGGKAAKSGARGVIALVVVLIFGGAGMFSGFRGAADSIGESPTVGFFGLNLPWLLVLALYLLPAVGFLLVGSTRRMASERAHVLSKPQAVACLGTAAVLTLGGTWGLTESGYATMVVLYSLVIAGFVMATTVTPSLDEFAKGVRKASKEGRRYPLTWSDRGLNRIVVFVLAGIVLATTTIVWKVIEEGRGPVGVVRPVLNVSYSLPIAIGVLTVAYYGMGLQFFQLRFGRRGPTFFALFLFAIWLLPLIAGAIASASAASNWAPNAQPNVWPAALASLSPLFGIAISAGGMSETSGSMAVQACALVPALAFAVLFYHLLTYARRRVLLEVHPEPAAVPRPEAEVAMVG
jgi:hypothetical protein